MEAVSDLCFEGGGVGPIVKTGASDPSYSGGFAACAAVLYSRPEGRDAPAKILSSFVFLPHLSQFQLFFIPALLAAGLGP